MEVETVRWGACADAGSSGCVTGADCTAHPRGGSPSACREPPVGPCSPHREEERAPCVGLGGGGKLRGCPPLSLPTGPGWEAAASQEVVEEPRLGAGASEPPARRPWRGTLRAAGKRQTPPDPPTSKSVSETGAKTFGLDVFFCQQWLGSWCLGSRRW